MPTKVNHVSTAPITDQILAIRDSWHTKRHPFFRAFGEGSLALEAYAVRSFGLFYTRFYQLEDVRKMMAENLAEEEGFKALPQPGHEPHDHVELILATVPSVVCQAGRQRLTCFSNYHSAPHDRSRVDLGRFLRV